MKVTIIGGGFVGGATRLLAEKNGHDVIVVDKDPERGVPEIPSGSDLYFVCVPTNMMTNKRLDTSIVESVIKDIRKAEPKPRIVVRSTVPIGFCEKMRVEFMPEFLREKNWEADAINPMRVVSSSVVAMTCLYPNFMPRFIVTPTEAETVKLFANSYLAIRVAFFNELEEVCRNGHLDIPSVFEALCSDDRIGNYYNTPSVGFGGKCLPKDINEVAEFTGSSLFTGAIMANEKRIRKFNK